MRDRGQDAVIDPQHVILSTADQNVKKYLGREIAASLDVPLVVIVAKFDAWSHLLGGNLPEFFIPPRGTVAADATAVSGLRLSAIEDMSRRIRALMLELSPEIVAATERFSRNVYFVPVSATGTSPRLVGRDAGSGKPSYKFRVGDLTPQWVEVPLLWMLAKHVPGLVPTEIVAKRD
jgi:hypothetical protein